nr:immunoglobulin light chain junction region [Macaca mulatta]MOW04835.1 immunoglobulin light chain junction region [Macaca mulatta]MOW06811.1 immunoglobulin light chain junction region [Macaca mulatta]MOW07593.1 immunoglobulin light chain junction region [Macaca mulatta]MOW66416.1 immunoglobulin light chain junction region [Macaca mulatta]
DYYCYSADNNGNGLF